VTAVAAPARATSRSGSRATSSRSGSRATSAFPFSEVRPFVGIDTLRVRGNIETPTDFTVFNHLGMRNLSDEGFVESNGVVRVAEGPTFKVDFKHEPAEATFEFSVPSLLHGHNSIAVSVEEALDAVDRAMRRAPFEWLDEPGNLRMARLDLVRDFQFSDDGALNSFIEGQRLLDPPYRPPVQTWTSSSGYTNLRWGTGKRWRVSVYDKAAEIRARAFKGRCGPERDRLLALAEQASGILRNELLLRRPVLKEQGMNTMNDLTTDKAQRLHRKYFERAGLNQEIGNLDKIRTAALLADEHDQKLIPKVVGMLYCDAHDIAHTLSRNTTRHYKNVAKRLDLNPADVAGNRDGSVRLDYELGELVGGSDAG
jgi:hypothetical protein